MLAIEKKCIDCPRIFAMTGKEREFYHKKGMPEPKRCRPCRAARKPLKGGVYHPLGGEHQNHTI